MTRYIDRYYLNGKVYGIKLIPTPEPLPEGTICDIDFANTYENIIESQNFLQYDQQYWLSLIEWEWLKWHDYESDSPACVGVQLPSVDWKKHNLHIECELYCEPAAYRRGSDSITLLTNWTSWHDVFNTPRLEVIKIPMYPWQPYDSMWELYDLADWMTYYDNYVSFVDVMQDAWVQSDVEYNWVRNFDILIEWRHICTATITKKDNPSLTYTNRFELGNWVQDQSLLDAIDSMNWYVAFNLGRWSGWEWVDTDRLKKVKVTYAEIHPTVTAQSTTIAVLQDVNLTIDLDWYTDQSKISFSVWDSNVLDPNAWSISSDRIDWTSNNYWMNIQWIADWTSTLTVYNTDDPTEIWFNETITVWNPTPPTPVTQHNVDFTDDGSQLWTVDVASATVDDWTVITVNNNLLTFWNTTITATPETWCIFDYWAYEGGQVYSWDTVTIQGDCEFTAHFDYDPQAVQQSAAASVQDELDWIDPNDFLNVLWQQ